MKIICIGLNYDQHIKDLGWKKPEEPLIFLKPDSAVIPKKNPFIIPAFSDDIHYETEVLIKINKVGKCISQRFAHNYYDEIGLGIDFCARDLQLKLKAEGHPWEKSKGFDGSAFIGPFFPKEQFDLNEIHYSLVRNGEKVQTGNTKDMIFQLDEIIAYVSQYYTLKKGDVIFTGTTAGEGRVASKDVLEGYLEDEKVFELKVR